MSTKELFKNFNDEYLNDSQKFAEWILELYKSGNVQDYDAILPFAEELVARSFQNSIPLSGHDKVDFIYKFKNYREDADKYSFELEDLLAKVNINCSGFKKNISDHINRLLKETEEYFLKKNCIPNRETHIKLFYNMAHCINGSDIFPKLDGVTRNVKYLKENKGVHSLEELINWKKTNSGGNWKIK